MPSVLQTAFDIKCCYVWDRFPLIGGWVKEVMLEWIELQSVY